MHFVSTFNLARTMAVLFINFMLVLFFFAYVFNTAFSFEKTVYVLVLSVGTALLTAAGRFIKTKRFGGGRHQLLHIFFDALSAFGIILIVAVWAAMQLTIDQSARVVTFEAYLHPVSVANYLSAYYTEMLLGSIIMVVLVSLAAYTIDRNKSLGATMLTVAFVLMNIAVAYYGLADPEPITNNSTIRLASGILLGGSLLWSNIYFLVNRDTSRTIAV